MNPSHPASPGPPGGASRRRGARVLPPTAALLSMLFVGIAVETARAGEAVEGRARVTGPGVIVVGDRTFALYGVRNPKGGQSCVRNAKPWNCAEGARTALRQHLEDRTVRCVPERDNDDVARCSVGDEDLSALLVREGWARADRDVSGEDFLDEEKQARKARRGIWATDDDNPEEVRRQQQRTY